MHDVSTQPLRISFCTTCHGRLEHLKQTLPKNLEVTQAYPNAEFVILDYGDKDGLGDWIRKEFPEEIASGRIRYARYESKHFRTSHAKNMAHRLGTGEVLCNLDADNFLAPGFAQWLNEVFRNDMDSVVMRNRDETCALREQGVLNRGTSGRIAISQSQFRRIQGYCENSQGWGLQDAELVERARDKAGLKIVTLPTTYYGNAVEHDDSERIQNAPELAQAAAKLLLDINDHGRVVRMPKYRDIYGEKSRDGRFGCGEVTLLKPDLTEEKLIFAPGRDKSRGDAMIGR